MIRAVFGLGTVSSSLRLLLGLTGLPAVAGTLGMLWNGLAFLCAITGLTAAAAGLTALATAISTIVGAIKGFAMSPQDSAKAMQTLDGLERTRRHTSPSDMIPQDMPAGRDPITGEKMGFHTDMPAPRAMQINLHGSVPITADGRTIAHVVGEKLAAVLTNPPRGSYAPDPSIAPHYGAQLA